MRDILLITPPFTQLNTPYPATPYLKGFLNTINEHSFQMDLGIEVVLELFSEKGLCRMFDFAYKNATIDTSNLLRIYSLRESYESSVDAVISFLQGRNHTLARLISSGDFLPRASRFDQLEDYEWAFGSMGVQDKAKYLATLYLEDLSDFVIGCVDEKFGFSRYAERLGRSANTFDELYNHLQQELTYIDQITIRILSERIADIQPRMVCLSVPFPGNLYSAFRCAQFLKQTYPEISVVMGGGFPNTELRQLNDVRVFEFFDFIILDDGERPLELLVKSILSGNRSDRLFLKRTYMLKNREVVFVDNSNDPDFKQCEVGTPDYSDLWLDRYISVIEVLNPMHTIWSDGRWNKLTMAHGCYWGKCTFCDGSLSYIQTFDSNSAELLVDRMEQLIEQTGESGFHFVDEAAPPALMTALALEIIKRKLTVTWWTNVRFEKSFTYDVCQLLKRSGCIAVSGGLEVASDRLLKLIHKGVTIEQVAQVARHFTEAGMMVHAYLMYGFPSQTVQETIDSLELVRQMFQQEIVQSGFWHQFALTAHSPIGLNPEAYGIVPDLRTITFANNDVQFTDQTKINHDQFSFGLKKSLFNYMHGICFEEPLQKWFDFKVPKTTVSPDFIAQVIALDHSNFNMKPQSKVIWLGVDPVVSVVSKSKKGKIFQNLQMEFQSKSKPITLSFELEKGTWFQSVLSRLSVFQDETLTYGFLKDDFEKHFDDFELFWFSKSIHILRAYGLLIL